MAGNWVKVTKSFPCPICKHLNWCAVTADGAIVKCMRTEAGAFKTGNDASGHYYLHRRGNNPGPDVPIPPRPGAPEPERADPDNLNAVYSAWLAELPLSNGHRENLRWRGLTDEQIDRGGYKTMPVQGRARIARTLWQRFGEVVLRVPGIAYKQGRQGEHLTLCCAAGMLIPCRDLAGRITTLKVRRDEVNNSEDRYRYVTSAGYGGPGAEACAHAPLGTPQTAERARVTEGELKADVIAARIGETTVSAPGASSWKVALDMLKTMGCKIVCLAYDADVEQKPTVARSLSAFAGALAAVGIAVELERWQLEDGKGLDDLLANGKTPELLLGEAALAAIREILATATAGEEAKADELDRLPDVLAAGGAEALFRDKALLQALADLAAADPAAFEAVCASIVERVSRQALNRALQPFRRQTPQGGGASPLYFEEGGCLHRNAMTPNGPVPTPLCNFVARIVEDVEHDDGAEKTRHLAVEGKLAAGPALPRVEVPAADFPAMGWVMEKWGTRAVVFAGQVTRDHLRAALQLLSGEVPRRTVYKHTGWRKIDDVWYYLHAGGAIGPEGHVDIPVLLPDPLAEFRLPAPPAPRPSGVRPFPGELGTAAQRESVALVDAVRASIGMLRLGPGRLQFPLLAAAYRAAMGGTDFSAHLSGPTGSYKTENVALAEQHYGAGMDARHLPASWSSTANANEGLAFAAKDALLVVDDFCPTGSTADVQRYHKEADRLFRGQGNHSGRQRMNRDCGLRIAKPPRGLLLSTGEDTPRGQSLRARLLSLDVSPGDLGPQPPATNPKLTACQQDAAAGKYALAMAAFIRWLAPQYESVRGRMQAEADELRDQARADGQHARTPGIIADLALGLRYLLDFARVVGAVTEAKGTALWNQGWAALVEAGAEQARHLSVAEPAGQFLRLLSAAITGGRAHLTGRDGNEPVEPLHWGWRSEVYYAGKDETNAIRFKPQGQCAGWLVDGEVYLEPDVSFAVVQELARSQGESFAVNAATLRRRLNEKGFLAAVDDGRKRLTIRMVLQGSRREVLHLIPNSLSPEPADDEVDVQADTTHERNGTAPHGANGDTSKTGTKTASGNGKHNDETEAGPWV